MSDLPTPKLGEPSGPALVPAGAREGLPIPLTRPFILIGSRTRSHLHLVSKTISRSHACLIRGDNGYYLRDLASRTGVVVNGKRVKEVDLRDGDNIEVGSFRFRYTSPPISFAVPASAPEAALLSVDAGAFTPIDARTFLIGRRGKADISLNSQAVSKSHALLFRLDGKHQIRDLGSRTGTLVNGNPVRQHVLEFGDEIRVGEHTFLYQEAIPRQPAPSVSEPPPHVAMDPLSDCAPSCPLAPAEDPDVCESPVEVNAPAVASHELQGTQEPSPGIAAEGLPAQCEFVPSCVLSEVEELTDASESDPQDQSDAGDFDNDESGPVPWRGTNGQPIFVRMHVPGTLDYFPALWAVVDTPPRASGRRADQSH